MSQDDFDLAFKARAHLDELDVKNAEIERLKDEVQTRRIERDDARISHQRCEQENERLRAERDDALAAAEIHSEEHRKIRGKLLAAVTSDRQLMDKVMEGLRARVKELEQLGSDLVVELGDCDLTDDASEAATALLRELDRASVHRLCDARDGLLREIEQIRLVLIEELDDAWECGRPA
ncbi:MAG: hypothetical protein AAFQ82_05835, partial [Myxococcota bacterium]